MLAKHSQNETNEKKNVWLCEEIYGKNYTEQIVSNLTNQEIVLENVRFTYHHIPTKDFQMYA